MSAGSEVYRKHNSFVELRHRHDGAEAKALDRVKELRSRAGVGAALSNAHHTILDRVWADLFGESVDATPRFAIGPSVAEEINSLDDKDLPRYLVHRYRYELFPYTRELDDYPPYLQIEPSSICNYRCVFCFETDKFFTRKSNGFMGHMSIDTFRRVIDQAAGNVEFISLASRGEPLLCPDIEAMLAFTRGKFLNLKLNTNASLLDERKTHAILQSGVKTLVFSADAAEEPLYSQLRVGGKLDQVLANVERFQKIRHTQYPASRIITRVSGVKFDDRQDLDAMQSRWGDLADQVAFVNYNPWENVYERTLAEIAAPCSDLWRRMFVWWDGKVNPCDVDYRSTLSVGSVASGNLSQLWLSAAYASLRSAHLENRRSSLTACSRCTVV
jgi:sulfatase maturation enzyme AslB (radical SAM superfamily)